MSAQTSLSRDEALSKLRALEPELRAKGVAALYLFGSTARDEAGPDSDVDVFADFAPDARLSWGYGDIPDVIASHLGRSVDFMGRLGLHKLIRADVEEEAIKVYG